MVASDFDLRSIAQGKLEDRLISTVDPVRDPANGWLPTLIYTLGSQV